MCGRATLSFVIYSIDQIVIASLCNSQASRTSTAERSSRRMAPITCTKSWSQMCVYRARPNVKNKNSRTSSSTAYSSIKCPQSASHRQRKWQQQLYRGKKSVSFRNENAIVCSVIVGDAQVDATQRTHSMNLIGRRRCCRRRHRCRCRYPCRTKYINLMQIVNCATSGGWRAEGGGRIDDGTSDWDINKLHYYLRGTATDECRILHHAGAHFLFHSNNFHSTFSRKRKDLLFACDSRIVSHQSKQKPTTP